MPQPQNLVQNVWFVHCWRCFPRSRRHWLLRESEFCLLNGWLFVVNITIFTWNLICTYIYLIVIVFVLHIPISDLVFLLRCKHGSIYHADALGDRIPVDNERSFKSHVKLWMCNFRQSEARLSSWHWVQLSDNQEIWKINSISTNDNCLIVLEINGFLSKTIIIEHNSLKVLCQFWIFCTIWLLRSSFNAKTMDLLH